MAIATSRAEKKQYKEGKTSIYEFRRTMSSSNKAATKLNMVRLQILFGIHFQSCGRL
jgi:hypothetical protein